MLVVLLIKRSPGLESSNAGTLLPVVMSMIRSDFETASGEGDRNQPQYEENDEYQGRRCHVHGPSPR